MDFESKNKRYTVSLKINVGCGTKPMAGFVNVDVFDFKGIDVKHDLNKYPYPFKTETADQIYCSHVIEHLDDPAKCLTELHRILKNGGKLIIKVPHFAHSSAFSSWQHKHYFAITSFSNLAKKSELDWWTPVFSSVNVRIHFGGFYKYSPFAWLSKLLIKIHPQFYDETILKTFAPVAEIDAILIK